MHTFNLHCEPAPVSVLVLCCQQQCNRSPTLEALQSLVIFLWCCADPPAGDVGNAQYATCPAKQTPAMLSSNSYSYNQAITVSAPAASGRVRGPFSLPAGALSAECSSMAQVGFMARMPASLKVSHTAAAEVTALFLCAPQ